MLINKPIKPINIIPTVKLHLKICGQGPEPAVPLGTL